jgi:ATP-binding cassette, subfamily D (ALD), peroxisomal long-chain fatty acid import protein
LISNSSMTVQSTLRPRVALLTKKYSAHRPVIQKLITTGFVIYVLGYTFRSLAVRPAGKDTPPTKGKGKGKQADGKVPRVAVRLISQ